MRALDRARAAPHRVFEHVGADHAAAVARSFQSMPAEEHPYAVTNLAAVPFTV